MGNEVITIDGPAASGKTSVSRAVAADLGWSWVSTGAFYRGLAFVASETQVALDDEEALAQLVGSSDWEVKMTQENTLVLYKGEDVTSQIFLEKVGSVASQISQFPRVRESLLAGQRACADGVNGLVAEGRDCGTVVFPEAQVKIYLTARGDARAARRAKEQGVDEEKVRAQQEVRDAQDENRKAAPMQIPPNAHVVDTSQMNLEQVVTHVTGLVREQLGKSTT